MLSSSDMINVISWRDIITVVSFQKLLPTSSVGSLENVVFWKETLLLSFLHVFFVSLTSKTEVPSSPIIVERGPTSLC